MSNTKPSRKYWVAGAGLAVACLSVMFLLPRHPSPDSAAQVYWDHVERGEWGQVYDMASDYEKRLQPWSREQFVGLMEDIAMERVGTMTLVSTVGDYQYQTTRKHFEFKYKYTRSDSGYVAFLAVPFYSSADSWHPGIFDLPLQLYAPKRPRVLADRQFLYDMCVKHKITAFVRHTDKVGFIVERLKEFLDGKREYASVSASVAKY